MAPAPPIHSLEFIACDHWLNLWNMCVSAQEATFKLISSIVKHPKWVSMYVLYVNNIFVVLLLLRLRVSIDLTILLGYIYTYEQRFLIVWEWKFGKSQILSLSPCIILTHFSPWSNIDTDAHDTKPLLRFCTLPPVPSIWLLQNPFSEISVFRRIKYTNIATPTQFKWVANAEHCGWRIYQTNKCKYYVFWARSKHNRSNQLFVTLALWIVLFSKHVFNLVYVLCLIRSTTFSLSMHHHCMPACRFNEREKHKHNQI